MKPKHPTLLRIPSKYIREAAGELVLPRPPEHYDVRQVGDEWRVTIGGTEELIYAGAGPVEIITSTAPL